MLIDYDNSILSVISSIMGHFELEPAHACFKELNAYLSKGYENIVLMVLDGMGSDALKNNLPEDSFLRRHYKRDISSVFPPTTTAALTTLDSGLSPVEHGWLGWRLYFHELDRTVNIFPNTLMDSEEKAANYHVAWRHIPYTPLTKRINDADNAYKAYYVSKFGNVRVEKLNELFDAVRGLCAQPGKKYIWAYWDDPDYTMHETGCYSRETKAVMKELNEGIRRMVKGIKNALVIVLADHGHKNTSYIKLCDNPALMSMLKRPTTLESRAAVFYVKEECLGAFPEAFERVFGDSFTLFTKEEAYAQKLFGEGTPHARVDGFLGDYLAVATKDIAMAYNEASRLFVSNHAGLTASETVVPFIIIEC